MIVGDFFLPLLGCAFLGLSGSALTRHLAWLSGRTRSYEEYTTVVKDKGRSQVLW